MRRVGPHQYESARVATDDDGPVLNAMFADVAAMVAAGHRVVVDWRGDWITKETVHVRGDGCRQLCGSVTCATATNLDRIVLLEGTNARVYGLRVFGGPSAIVNFSQRTCNDGVVIGKTDGMYIDTLEVRSVRRWAVETIGDASHSAVGCIIGTLYAVDCGSPGGGASPGSSAVLELTWSNPVRNLTAGNANQTITADIDSGALEHVYPDDLVWLGESPHLVESVDTNASEIALYNWPSHADTSGSILSGHGGALSSKGGNTGGFKALAIYGRRCGGLVRTGLYMGSDVELIGEVTSYAIQIGLTTGGILLGGSCSIQLEAATKACVIKATRVAARYEVNLGAGAHIADCFGLTIHDASGNPRNDRWSSLEGVSFLVDGSKASASDQIEISHGIAPIRASDDTIINVSNRQGENRGTFAFDGSGDDVEIEISWYEDDARVLCKSVIELDLIGLDYTTASPGTVTLRVAAGHGTFGDPSGSATTKALALTGPTRVLLKRYPDPDVATWFVMTQPYTLVT